MELLEVRNRAPDNFVGVDLSKFECTLCSHLSREIMYMPCGMHKTCSLCVLKNGYEHRLQETYCHYCATLFPVKASDLVRDTEHDTRVAMLEELVPASCKYCHWSGTVFEKEAHDATCIRYPVECILCGDKVKRGEMVDHIDGAYLAHETLFHEKVLDCFTRCKAGHSKYMNEIVDKLEKAKIATNEIVKLMQTGYKESLDLTEQQTRFVNKVEQRKLSMMSPEEVANEKAILRPFLEFHVTGANFHGTAGFAHKFIKTWKDAVLAVQEVEIFVSGLFQEEMQLVETCCTDLHKLKLISNVLASSTVCDKEQLNRSFISSLYSVVGGYYRSYHLYDELKESMLEKHVVSDPKTFLKVKKTRAKVSCPIWTSEKMVENWYHVTHDKILHGFDKLAVVIKNMLVDMAERFKKLGACSDGLINYLKVSMHELVGMLPYEQESDLLLDKDEKTFQRATMSVTEREGLYKAIAHMYYLLDMFPPTGSFTALMEFSVLTVGNAARPDIKAVIAQGEKYKSAIAPDYNKRKADEIST